MAPQNFGAKPPRGGSFGAKVGGAALSFGAKVARGISRATGLVSNVGGAALTIAELVPGARAITAPARMAVDVARGISNATGVISNVMDVGARGLSRDTLEKPA